MLGFGVLAGVPALIISRLIAPRRRYNPIKFLPMECGQMPTGEGRSHFMMQYYSYILMFVVFDVMSIFLFAWASSLFLIPRTATLSIMAFLGIMFAANGLCVVSVRKERNMVSILLISIKYVSCKEWLGDWFAQGIS